MEETIIAQNPELDLLPGEIDVKFIHTTKWGQTKIVIKSDQRPEGNFNNRN